METGEKNFRHAFALLDGLVRAGLDTVVISPGARSTPLVISAAQHPAIKTHVVLDERSAGFFALGLAKKSGNPVGLICTSGSAVANWYPAVLEADAGKIPLILLSADRPAELRACGANQTTDQIKIFANSVRAFHELHTADESNLPSASFAAKILQKSLHPLPGPVHINIAFREPLLPAQFPQLPTSEKPNERFLPQTLPDLRELDALSNQLHSAKGLIVCGWDIYPADFSAQVLRLARHLNVPILADPLTNLRQNKEHVLCGYDAFLKNADFCTKFKPDWVLRFGALPVSKSLGIFLSSLTEATHITIDSHGNWQDPHGLSEKVIHSNPALFCDHFIKQTAKKEHQSEWLPAWVCAEEKTRTRLATQELPSEAHIINELAATLPSGAVLFCGNSTPVRHLDSFLSSGHNGFDIACNRGLSGIDGNISTATGIAATGCPVVAFVGDLTMAHDISALGLGKGVNITIIVINNGGGGIFEYLPHSNLDRTLFETYWLANHAPDLKAASAAYGCSYHSIKDIKDFKDSLAQCLTHHDCDLIEVFINREDSVKAHKALWQHISEEPLVSGA